KQLQQPAIAGTVNTRRSRDRHFDAQTPSGFAYQVLAFELGDLIDVARLQRRIFARGRTGDVAVDADGAAVDDAACAPARCGLDDLRRPARVDGAVDVVRDARLTVNRRDVVDDLDAARGGVE